MQHFQTKSPHQRGKEGDTPKVTEPNLRFPAVFCANLRFWVTFLAGYGIIQQIGISICLRSAWSCFVAVAICMAKSLWASATCQALARVFRVVKQIVLVARARVHICFCCTRWAVFPVYPCAWHCTDARCFNAWSSEFVGMNAIGQAGEIISRQTRDAPEKKEKQIKLKTLVPFATDSGKHSKTWFQMFVILSIRLFGANVAKRCANLVTVHRSVM